MLIVGPVAARRPALASTGPDIVAALPSIRASRVLPGALALLLAVLLYTRFGFDGRLSRDEAILAYGAQQWAHGVPFYTSIFDAKGPLASALGGLAAWAASIVDLNDLSAIRCLFLVMACAAAVGVYLLAVGAWDSQLGGVAAAVTFISFQGFAVDAAGGPDAKTPGILFAVACMTLLLRRRWFAGGVLAAMAALVWQPFGLYALLAVAAAAAGAVAGSRVRSAVLAIAGVATPVVVTFAYYLAAGSLGDLVDGMIVFPLTGVERSPETLGHRLRVITSTVDRYYGDSRVLLWGGLVLLPALIAWCVLRRRSSIRDPLVVGVLGSGVVVAILTASDFQGYPDVFPLLPYAALGIGGAIGLGVKAITAQRARQLATAAAIAGMAVLVAVSWHAFTKTNDRVATRSKQQAVAKRLTRLAGPGGVIWTLGNPDVLVLTDRRNPSRYVYLNSGFDAWVGNHVPGGLRGFADRILSSRPAVVVVDEWYSKRRRFVLPRLETVYRPRLLGKRLVLLSPDAVRRARASGTALPPPA